MNGKKQGSSRENQRSAGTYNIRSLGGGGGLQKFLLICKALILINSQLAGLLKCAPETHVYNGGSQGVLFSLPDI